MQLVGIMEEDRIAVINVAIEVKIINIAYASNSTAEDLCIKVFKYEFCIYFCVGL